MTKYCAAGRNPPHPSLDFAQNSFGSIHSQVKIRTPQKYPDFNLCRGGESNTLRLPLPKLVGLYHHPIRIGAGRLCEVISGVSKGCDPSLFKGIWY